MYTHQSKIRVRYAETDQMGYVYYANYARYYEIGRVEGLRALGITYKSLEERGIMLPVVDLKCKFIKPAFYDDELLLTTKVIQVPGVKILFEYELHNASEQLINIGSTTLYFLDAQNRKPIDCPADLKEKIAPFFEA